MKMNSKHLLIRLACCSIPLAQLAAIAVFKFPANNILTFGTIMLCPRGYLLMMKCMMPGYSHQYEGYEPKTKDTA